MESIVHPMALPITVPLLTGLICLLIPRDAERTRSVVAVLSTAVTVGLVWPLFSERDALLELGSWFSLRVDGLSAFVLLAIAVFGFLIAL